MKKKIEAAEPRVAEPPPRGLESVPKRELKPAVVSGRGKYLALRAISDAGVRRGEVWMVKGVEGIDAQFELLALDDGKEF